MLNYFLSDIKNYSEFRKNAFWRGNFELSRTCKQACIFYVIELRLLQIPYYSGNWIFQLSTLQILISSSIIGKINNKNSAKVSKGYFTYVFKNFCNYLQR